MLGTLKKPFPLITDTKKILVSNFLIGAFVAMFLIIFQPFGISVWQIEHKNFVLAGFGLISFLTPSIYQLIKNIGLNNTTAEDNWTIGKEIISSILVLGFIALFNLLYFSLVTGVQISAFGYLQSAITVIAIGIFPISYGLINKHNKFNALNLEKVKALNDFFDAEKLASYNQIESNTENLEYAKSITSFQSLQTNAPLVNKDEKLNDELIFTAENEKDTLKINSKDFLFIEAEDNYAAIFYLDNNTLKRNLMRSSLKRLLEQNHNEYILQCHRAFVVNLKQVIHVEGNAAGYRLIIKGSKTEVPVSRSYAKIIVTTLKQLNHE